MRHKHSVTEDPVKVAGIAAIAAAIGAFVALLFTPRSGGQVRRGLKRRAAHLKDEVHNKFDSSIEEVGDTTKEAKVRLQSTADKVVKDAKSTAAKTAADTKVVKSRATKAAVAAKPTTRKRTPKAQ